MTPPATRAPANPPGEGQALSATDIRYPGPGEVIEVSSGQALVFAHAADGRRIPVCSVAAGSVLVGCAARGAGSGRIRMLVTGLPGTTVRERDLADLVRGDPDPVLQGWIALLGAAVANGGWPTSIVALAAADIILAPGEHVTGPAERALSWAVMTRGSATLCGVGQANLTPADGILPLPRGTWLTAGLRARIEEGAAPSDPQAWAAALDTLGGLVLAGMVGRRGVADEQGVSRLISRTDRADSAGHEAVDILVGAVGGRSRPPQLGDEARSAQLAAAALVAQAAGLVVTDEALLRAAADVESGREPATAVAAACGGRARPVLLAPQWWTHEGAPVLVQVRAAGTPMRHQALVRRRDWVLLDPAGDAQLAVDRDVAATVAPQAVEFLPALPARPANLRDLGSLALRGSGREMVVVLAVTVMLAGLSFVTPYLMGKVSTLFVARATGQAWAGLFGAMALVVIAGVAWQAVRALALLRTRAKAAAMSAGALWERVMRQRASWHSEYGLGNRAAQASAVNNASAALPDEVVTRLLDMATVVGSLAAAWTAGAALMWSLAALLGLQLLLTAWLLRSAAARAAERVNAAASATGRLIETLLAVNRLRVAGAESRAFLRWARVQARFSRADLAMRRTTMIQGIVIAVWPVLALVVVVAVTALTNASFGAFVTAQTAAAAATSAVAAMSLAANSTLVARQSLRIAGPALARAPEGSADGIQPGVLSGRLEISQLVFRYTPDGPPVLDGLSLSVAPGEHVAIVGASGCGKTTLMRVVLGLEEPESGVIAVDGRDMAALDRPAVRRQIGSVLQSAALLPGTIKDNIDMGRFMTPDQIWAALEAAALADDVRALAMGIDTPVTDGGGSLSGGQRQRVLIARALAGSPRMLILDEATSALDNLTQSAVVDALSRLRITRIVVAHRLSTIRHADRVVVLGGGRIIEEGRYEDLVAQGGVFAGLVARQQA